MTIGVCFKLVLGIIVDPEASFVALISGEPWLGALIGRLSVIIEGMYTFQDI